MLNEEQAEFVHNAVCGVPDDQRKDGDEEVLGYLLEELDIILCRVQLSDPFDWLMDYILTDRQCGMIINALNIYVDNCPRSYIQEVETIIELLDDEVHAHYHGIKFATLN